MIKEHCLDCKFFDAKNEKCHHNSPLVIEVDGRVESYYPTAYPNTVACANHESADLSMKEAFDILNEFNKRHNQSLNFNNLDD